MAGREILERDLDLNGKRVFGPAAPVNPTDVVRLQDLTGALTFQQGVSLAGSIVTGDYITGKVGNQTWIGGINTGDGLTIKASSNASPGPMTLFESQLVVSLAPGTIPSGVSAVFDGVKVPAATVAISGGTSIGTATGFNLASIAGPVLNGALTIAAAATLAILGPPTGTATITAPYSLWVEAGTTYLAGTTKIQSLTGMLKGTSGTVSAATAGVDYQAPLSAADATIVFPAATTIKVGVVTGANVGGFTSGSVIFAASDGTLTQNNPSFYFDNVHARLAINGTTSPQAPLHVINDAGTARAIRFSDAGGADYVDFVNGGTQTRLDVALAKAFLITQAGTSNSRIQFSAAGNLRFDSATQTRFATGGVRIDDLATTGYVFNTSGGNLSVASEAGWSILGRNASTPGPIAAITGSANGQALRIVGNLVGWGTLVGASVGGFTAGSVIFAASDGTLTEDNAKFFWDDAHGRLGIGVNAPVAPIQAVIDPSTARAFRFQDAGGTDYLDFINGGAQARFDISLAKQFLITQGGTSNSRIQITAGGDLRFDPVANFRIATGSVRTDGLGSTGLIKNNNGSNWTIATAGVDYENALTFSQGLTRASNSVTGDYITGVATNSTTWTGTTTAGPTNGALTIRSTSNATRGPLTLDASAISIPGDIVSPTNPIRLQIGAGLTVVYIDNAQHVGIGGIAPGASQVLDLALTESVGASTSATLDAFLVRGSTITVTGGTAITTAAGFNYHTIKGPTYSGSAAITNAATVAISGAPTGSGLTITNRYALWVQADPTRFDGTVQIQTLSGILKATAGIVGVGSAGVDFESPLTFSQGVTRVANAITGDYITGIAGSTTWTGSTTASATLTIRSTNMTRGPITLDSSVVNIPGDLISASNPIRLQTGGGITAVYIDSTQHTGFGGVAPGATSVVDISATETIASGIAAIWDGFLVRGSTVTLTGGTTISTANGFNLAVFKKPAINGAGVVTNAATVAISGAPNGTATLTNSYALWVQGDTSRFDGTLRINDIIVSPTNDMRLQTGAGVTGIYLDGSQRVGIGGVAPGANNRFRIGTALPTITLGGSTLLNYVQIDATTVQLSGAATDSVSQGFNYVAIGAPAYNNASASSITNAATLMVAGAPVATGSLTITNAYAFWVQGGGTRLDGTLFINQDIVTTGGGAMRLQTGAGVTGVYIDGSQRIGLGGVLPSASNESNRLRVGGAVPAITPLSSGESLNYVLLEGTTVNLTGTTHITTASGFNYVRFNAPTYSNASAMTIDNAATMVISGPPLTSGSLAITRPYAFWVQSGLGNFSGTAGSNADNTPSQARLIFRAPIFQSTQINPYVSEKGTLWIPIQIDGPLSSANVFGGVETATVGYIPVLVHD